jgi:hypothetical protein
MGAFNQQWLGVSPGVLFASLGPTITAREDHLRTFDLIVPGFDFERDRRAKEAAGYWWRVIAEDFCPDAIAVASRLGKKTR